MTILKNFLLYGKIIINILDAQTTFPESRNKITETKRFPQMPKFLQKGREQADVQVQKGYDCNIYLIFPLAIHTHNFCLP